MKSKNKIMDSFEEFIALPLSILKNRMIQITGYKSDFVSSKSIDIELSDDKIHINCVNSESAYNLLYSEISMLFCIVNESNSFSLSFLSVTIILYFPPSNDSDILESNGNS